MSNEKYNQIIDDAYKSYWDEHSDVEKSFTYEGSLIETRRMTKDEFIDMVKTDVLIAERWGLKIEERELGLEERYNIWFNNNYETGMERYFNKNNLPNFEDDYYTVTPTRLITMTYKNETIEIYE